MVRMGESVSAAARPGAAGFVTWELQVVEPAAPSDTDLGCTPGPLSRQVLTEAPGVTVGQDGRSLCS